MTLATCASWACSGWSASCLNDACRHVALIDVSAYPADTEVPSFPASSVVYAEVPEAAGAVREMFPGRTAPQSMPSRSRVPTLRSSVTAERIAAASFESGAHTANNSDASKPIAEKPRTAMRSSATTMVTNSPTVFRRSGSTIDTRSESLNLISHRLVRPPAWPVVARGQQPATTMPVVGFRASSSAEAPAGRVAAILLALKQAGFEVGQTVRVEYRYANNQLDQLPGLAAELVRIPVAVLGHHRPRLCPQVSVAESQMALPPVGSVLCPVSKSSSSV
jgi:hypothetical protein